MSETSQPRRRGPYAKTAQRRRQILEAAYQTFAARGYHAGSLREVAAAAGVSLSTLMHHFPAKEDLLLSVLEQRDRAGAVDAHAEDVDRFVADVVAQARENESIPGLIALYSVLSAESATAGHPGREYFTSRFSSLRATYTAVFERLREAGRLRAGVDPRIAAASLAALWDGIQLQWMLQPHEIDVGEHLRAYLDLVLQPSDGGYSTPTGDAYID